MCVCFSRSLVHSFSPFHFCRFPAFPPTIYVIATSTVGIRTSPIVDSSGRVAINLPYFFWDPDTPNPAAAAVALVGAVSVAFGKAIPVYSRATGDGAPRESGVSPQDLVSRAALQRAVEKKIESRRRALETGEGSAIAQLRDVNARLRASAHELHVRQVSIHFVDNRLLLLPILCVLWLLSPYTRWIHPRPCQNM